MDANLDRYRQKRDFGKTPEPKGGEPSIGAPTFVVQKHAARRLHYDVRFEVDGVMPSWAVPKGPSYDPRAKRLAMHVEDHPLDYQTFEGIIPKGEYGGGSVIVWDNGTYRNLTEHDGKPVDMRTAIENGHVSVWFEGTKLIGGWSLTRTQDNAWIMVKRKDDHANPERDVVDDEPASVLTGRTVEQVAVSSNEREWTRSVAVWVPPMLAQSCASTAVVSGEGWMFERKLDGLRCIAVRNGDDVELWSRNHLPFTPRFPMIVDALRELPVDNFTLDGELVAFDGDRTSFQSLQQGGGALPQLHVFDVIHLLGNETTALPLEQRRKLVAQLLPLDHAVLKSVDLLSGNADTLLDRACREGWEGLIAKRANSTYASGRSSQWRKLKCSASQEMVIGGWTEPKGARVGFGALLVGCYDKSGLRFAGKVGTGFDHATLMELYAKLVERETDSSPFVDSVKERGAHWAGPDLVAAIEFAEWTKDGKLRHARFLGLRSDKPAHLVVRE